MDSASPFASTAQIPWFAVGGSSGAIIEKDCIALKVQPGSFAVGCS